MKGKEEEVAVSFHGVAYVDLAPLLYPGVSKIHGAFLVQPFNETEMIEQFNHKSILTEDIIKTMIGAQRSSSGLGGTKNAGKKTDTKTKVSNRNQIKGRVQKSYSYSSNFSSVWKRFCFTFKDILKI